MSIVAITLPVPAGAFIPVFTLGAAIGRFVGEALAFWFPDGLHSDHPVQIIPGSYAVVGAAAFAGAATHTISTTVIVSELTGQINHILPLAFAVLTANFVAKALDLNIFDSIIRIKKLPYLPDISTSDHTAFNIFVDDFMVKDAKYLSYTDSYYSEIKNLLDKTKLRSCPLVDSHQHMVLLGSVQRAELQLLLDRQIGRERRMREPQFEEEKVSIESRLSSRRNSSVMETMPNLAGLDQVKEQLKAIAHISQSWAPGESLGLPASAPPTLRGEPHWGDEEGTPKEPRKSILKRTSESKSNIGSDTEGELEGGSSVPGSPKSGGTEDDVFLPAITLETPSGKQKKATTTTAPSIATTSAAGNPLSDVFSPPEGSTSDEEARKKHERSLRGSLSNVAKTLKAPFVKSAALAPPGRRVIDLSPEEQEVWEERQLKKIVDFNGCIIDPAPFQLVAHTSLHKVHSLFSLLSLKQAYVTNIGRLVGVVGLVELRKIIEGTSAGTAQPKPFVGAPSSDDIEMNNQGTDEDDDDDYYEDAEDEDEDDDSDAGSFMDLGPSDFEYGSDRLLDADQKIRANQQNMPSAYYGGTGDGMSGGGGGRGGGGGMDGRMGGDGMGEGGGVMVGGGSVGGGMGSGMRGGPGMSGGGYSVPKSMMTTAPSHYERYPDYGPPPSNTLPAYSPAYTPHPKEVEGVSSLAVADAVAVGAALGAVAISVPKTSNSENGSSSSAAAAAKQPGSRFRKFIVTEASETNGRSAAPAAAATPSRRTDGEEEETDDMEDTVV